MKLLKNHNSVDFTLFIEYIYPLNTLTMLAQTKKTSLAWIRKKASGSWVIVANPEYNSVNGNLERGELVYYSKDKLDVHKFIIDEIHAGLTHYSIFFTGKLRSNN